MSTLLCYFNCADSTHADVLDKNDKNIAVRNELILIIEEETILHSGCQSMLYSLYFFAKTRTVISSDILLKSTQKIFNLLQFLPIFFNCYDNYTILCCPSLFAYCFVTVPVAQIPVSPANYILFFYAFSNRYENYKAYKLPLHSLQSDEQLLRCLLVKIQAELIRKMQKITYSSNSLLSASLCLKSSSSSSVRNSSFFRVLKRRWSIPWSILWETNRPPKCTYFQLSLSADVWDHGFLKLFSLLPKVR